MLGLAKPVAETVANLLSLLLQLNAAAIRVSSRDNVDRRNRFLATSNDLPAKYLDISKIDQASNKIGKARWLKQIMLLSTTTFGTFAGA